MTPQRTNLEIPGFAHANPVPVAARIGDLLATGVLTGRDPATREMPETMAEQCANVFARIREVLDAAGGSTDDILKVTCWLAEYRDREALNREWLAMFPTDAPARQVMKAELDSGALIQVDLLAVLG